MAARKRRVRRREPEWVALDDEELLDVRFCDLRLELPGTALEERVERLHRELDRAGLVFKPYVWISSSWFTPDGLTGFAVPFYLAHTRLARLERKMMLEVEGGTRDSCMKLLRHETGHAISNAYGFHRRKSWREHFGRFSEPYLDTYAPRPYSKKFVVHLDNWYAQSHPCEDFAETFAVWMRPGWRKRYAGWPALRKLEYVDRIMGEVADQRPKARGRERPESLPRLRTTLREHYEDKRDRYGDDYDVPEDKNLLRLFSTAAAFAKRPSAARFLRENRAELRRRVSRMTGQYQYVVDQVLDEMIDTCLVANLRLTRSERETRLDAAILLTARILNYLQDGYHRYSR